jgi:hypothetical protein
MYQKIFLSILLATTSIIQAGSWWDTLAQIAGTSKVTWNLPSVKESEVVLDEWQNSFRMRAVLIEQYIAELASKIKAKLKEEAREKDAGSKKRFFASNTAFQAELGSVTGSLFNFARELQMTLLNTNHAFGYNLMNIVAHQQAAGQINKEPYDLLLKLNNTLTTGPLVANEPLNHDDISKIENYCTQLREISYQLMNSASTMIPHEARADAANMIGFYRRLLEQFNHTILQPLDDYMPAHYVPNRSWQCVGRYALFGAAACATATAVGLALYPHLSPSPLPQNLEEVQAALIMTGGLAGAVAAPTLRSIKETFIPTKKSSRESWWALLARKARGIKQISWELPSDKHAQEVVKHWQENFNTRSDLINAQITVLGTQIRSKLQLADARHPFDATNTAMIAELASVTGSIMNFARDLRMTILNVNHGFGFHLMEILGKKNDTKTYQLLLKLDALLETAPLAGKEAFNVSYIQKINVFTQKLSDIETTLGTTKPEAIAVAKMIADYRTLLTNFNEKILMPLKPFLPASNWLTWLKAATIGAGVGIAIVAIRAWELNVPPTDPRIVDAVFNLGMVGAAAGLGVGYKYATQGRERTVAK